MTTPVRKLLVAGIIASMSPKEQETLLQHFDMEKLKNGLKDATEAMQASKPCDVLAETIAVLRENFPEAAKPYKN